MLSNRVPYTSSDVLFTTKGTMMLSYEYNYKARFHIKRVSEWSHKPASPF